MCIRDSLRTVGTVGRRPDSVGVAAELADFLARGRVPDARRPVVTGGGDCLLLTSFPPAGGPWGGFRGRRAL